MGLVMSSGQTNSITFISAKDTTLSECCAPSLQELKCCTGDGVGMNLHASSPELLPADGHMAEAASASAAASQGADASNQEDDRQRAYDRMQASL